MSLTIRSPKGDFDRADTLRSEYVVGVKGKVFERESKNKDLPTGDIEVFAEDLANLFEIGNTSYFIKDDDNAR